jgi:hypothetical protein
MLKKTIDQSVQTINWFNERIVDWCRAGESYSMEGEVVQLAKYHFAYPFDSAIQSNDSQYVFIYQKLGTKGLLIKDGEILREINRSYYCADVYEYPATFLSYKGRLYLVHCPIAYCQLDFEDVETGEIVTNIKSRKPADIFHSRLEVSASGSYLMSKGWVWHPVDVVSVFSIDQCFANPTELDNPEYDFLDAGSEICTASFIDDDKVLVGSSSEVLTEENTQRLPARSIAIWNFHDNTFSNVITPAFEFGNLFAINERLCWDLYKFPKVIDLRTGQIADNAEDVYSGEQRSSIITEDDSQPTIAFDVGRKRLAISGKQNITVLIRERD